MNHLSSLNYNNHNYLTPKVPAVQLDNYMLNGVIVTSATYSVLMRDRLKSATKTKRREYLSNSNFLQHNYALLHTALSHTTEMTFKIWYLSVYHTLFISLTFVPKISLVNIWYTFIKWLKTFLRFSFIRASYKHFGFEMYLLGWPNCSRKLRDHYDTSLSTFHV